MPDKTVQVSVRVSEGDAAFLSSLDIAGTKTLSEKMRALLQQARQQREGRNDFATEFAFISDLHRSDDARRVAAERQLGMRSDLLRALNAWIVECDAYLLSATPDSDAKDDLNEWQEYEAGAADRVFALFDQVMRLGLTETCAGYSPDVVRHRLDGTVALLRALMSTYDGVDKGGKNA